MTFMHSITLEEVTLTGSSVRGLDKYHILYLFHSKSNPLFSLFEISEQTPFLKERKTIFGVDHYMRIIGYSTDTPILVLLDGRIEMVLMPNYHGDFIIVPVDHGIPPEIRPGDSDPQFIKIIGMTPHKTIQFLEFSP